MDGPQASLAGTEVAQAHGAAVLALGPVGTRQGAIDPLLRQLQAPSTPRVCVYAAGPCGAWLARSLTNKGCGGWGVALSWIPHKPGDRVTTDWRDARHLARLLRSGDLPPVSVPAVADAAIRDLRRAREAPLRDLTAATVRRPACVLRHALRAPGRATWSPAPLRWLSEVSCPAPAQPLVLQEDVQTVPAQTARLGRLAHARHAQGHTWHVAPVVEALQARRGVPCPVAVLTVAARGALTRCATPRPRMHDLGLTPSAYARGGRRQQGSLTKTGTTPARRALVADAWASREPAHVSRPRPLRREKLPTAMQTISGPAPGRLCPRYRPLMATGHHAH